MKVLILVLVILFVVGLIFGEVVSVLQRKKRKSQVAAFLATCNEEELRLINRYDACYKVNFGDLWRKTKKKK